MYIGVSGNLGSGKTTIARGLARAFRCELYPRRSYDTSYLEDLFREPKRWTTEAQIAFMVHKYDAIRQGMERGRFFVLDRTFGEDVEVFAERFHADGTIDARGIELIRQLASDLEARLEKPGLIVYCDCSVAVCKERLHDRPRSYQTSYPPDHLGKLSGRLELWLQRQTDVPVVTVATDRKDYRDLENLEALAREIDARLTVTQENQPDLFDQIEKEVGHNPPSVAGKLGTARAGGLFRPKRVYLAAPFTARASKRILEGESGSLFSDVDYADGIPRYYKGQLLALARAIESHGYTVLLPHRDINRWGKRKLTSVEVANRCLRALANSDCLVGLIGESFGSHAELGYALGLGKPSLILCSETNPTSFFGSGMAMLPEVATLRANSIPALIEMLKQEDRLLLAINGRIER